MFCYQCGGSLPDEALFCPRCGSRTMMSPLPSEAGPLSRPSTLRNAATILIGVGGVVSLFMVLGFVGWLGLDETERGDTPLAGMIALVAFFEALGLTAMVFGCALLLRKKWAKTAAMIWSAIVCFTVVGVLIGGPILYLLTRNGVDEYLKSGSATKAQGQTEPQVTSPPSSDSVSPWVQPLLPQVKARTEARR